MQYRIPPAADDDASCLPAVSAKAAGAGAMLPSRRLAGARRRPPSAAYIGRGGLIRSSSPASSPADLLGLQRIRGEFSWGPALESVLGMREEEALALGPAGAAEGVWLTALAVLHVELRAEEEGEGELWELVAEKGRAFVDGSCGGEEERRKIWKEAERVVRGIIYR